MRKMIASSAALLAASFACADTITFSGEDLATESIASFTGSMTWSYGGSGEGTLVVSLTNTSNPSNGGFLTGFVFNTAFSGPNLTLCNAPNASWLIQQNASGSPFGTFDWGAALGGNFLGGGSPAAGIAVGDTGTFTFCVKGDDSIISGLSAASFFDGDCTCEPGEENRYPFAARFRGFNDGGSDKVVACPPAVVPVPMPVALAAAGLLGVGLMRRRIK
ncbi:MAG: hypothetical protein ACO3IB_10345 [Phycisphaerales bacterium]